MKRIIIIKILSGLINILVCLILAIVILYFQDWFGSGDLRSLVFWTIPLAVGLIVSGRAILTLIRAKNQFLRLLLITFIAGIISFCFVYFVYMFLGPYINSFSFPVFYIWIAGSIGQLVFLDLLLPQESEKLNSINIILGIVVFPLTLLLTVVVIYLISLFCR